MQPTEAYNRLKPENWAATPIQRRIELLYAVKKNIEKYGDEFCALDISTRNAKVGEPLFSFAVSKLINITSVASTISSCINLYGHLKTGQLQKPEFFNEVNPGLYDINVYPRTFKQHLIASKLSAWIRVVNEPKQTSPLEKPPGVIAVIGSGNFSSTNETIKALFFENSTVILRLHPMNDKTNPIWEKIFEPLINFGAISICKTNDSSGLVKLNGLKKIFYSGSITGANKLFNITDTPIVTECGGNNPCLIVPGDRPWSKKEIQHHAIQIASSAKLTAGAICGRFQTIVTSKNWSQREQFLDAIRQAITESTPATGSHSYYTKPLWDKFLEHHPDAEVLYPEMGKYSKESSAFLFITNAAQNSYAVKNEAISQVLCEVALDTMADADDFLRHAVNFCNSNVYGTLGCSILIDPMTSKNRSSALKKAISTLNYGSVAVNAPLPTIFLNPYLVWGKNNKDKQFTTGVGNFGNAYGFQNVEKSIVYDDFIANGLWLLTNKKRFEITINHLTKYVLSQSWISAFGLIRAKILDRITIKDF